KDITSWVPWILTLIIMATLTWLYTTTKNERNRPPGPKGFPVLGYLPFLWNNPHLLFLKLAKVYGPIVRIKVSTVKIVVLNDHQCIREAFSHHAVQSRIKSMFLEKTGLPGVGTLNGKAWRENRQLSLHILRGLGFGKPALEEIILVEVQCLTRRLHAVNQAPIFVRTFTIPSMSNVYTKLLFGVRHPHDHATRAKLDECFLNADAALTKGSVTVFLPLWLYAIAGAVSFTRIGAFMSAFRGLMDFLAPEIATHQMNKKPNFGSDFIDAYLRHALLSRDDPKSNIKSRYLPGNLLSFWVAGTNAINRSVIWHLLNCADKPDTVQKAIQDEIDEVVGRERRPAWNDRYRMVYTMAAIWEMLRWRPISPMGLPRGTSEDVIIGGFTIPEGTIVMANLWAVNMDSSLWVHPEKFDPYRFIEESGAKLKPKPEYFIPFSIGWCFLTHIP
ncbi:unnamed protein product, partial [Ixodes persulcatus]